MNSTLIAAVFAVQVVLGVAGTLLVYKILEQNWMLGWIVSVTLVSTTAYTKWILGETLLTVSLEEMKLLVVVAVVGAMIGVLTTVIIAKPDLDTREQVQLEEPPVNQNETR